MCGIAGYVGKGTIRDLEQMITVIHHRGPDHRGVYTQPGIGLGHARLSIIDLTSTGHQPMHNQAQTIVIIFNGEIYNFQELKTELGTYPFRGTSDTEVILALYERYGEQCFEKLIGMFAIAIYDLEHRRLLLARDRMGKKPLYWGIFDHTLLFASEPKAILQHHVARKEINLEALNAYLALDYVPTPLSIYQNIHKLDPGTFLRYESGQVEKHSFWNPDFSSAPMALNEARNILDHHLRNATRMRLVSDVPLGVFLSGGLDSSAVAYYATQESTSKIHTFSIGFNEATFDESRYAKEVATYLHTNHHHKMLSGSDAHSTIPRILDLLDEPLADASIIPTHLLSCFAKEHVGVALGGDGGDELFAGYPTFQAEQMLPLYRLLPHGIRRSLTQSAAEIFPETFTDFNLGFQLRQWNQGAEETQMIMRHLRWLGTFSEEDRSLLLTHDVWAKLAQISPYAYALRALSAHTNMEKHNQLLFAYQRTYLMDQVMVKVDRASMYASLEVRAPLLDHRIVEFCNRLPYHLKLHGLTTKFLLKKTLEGKLPKHIIKRKKKGFSVPIGMWLRGPLRNWADEILSNAQKTSGNILSSEYIKTLWSQHLGGQRDHRKKLWNIIIFLEWKKRFLP